MDKAAAIETRCIFDTTAAFFATDNTLTSRRLIQRIPLSKETSAAP